MPIYKPRLTKNEENRYLEIAQEMAAAGTRLDIPEEWLRRARVLRLTIASSPESLIYQLSPSKVLYVLRMNLLPERSVTVQEFEVSTTWDPDISPCYPDGHGLYRFAPELDFNFKEVLNHRIENRLRLRRGDIREGWLLAMGFRPVPESYGLGRPAPVEVTFRDQFGRPSVAGVDLAVERSRKSKQCLSRNRANLFEPAEAPTPMQHRIDDDLIRPVTPFPPGLRVP